MKCPYCGFAESRVLESRSTNEGAVIRRRRACQKCETRYTTYERVEAVPLYVVKKDNRREPFNRDKILNGMVKACQKRPVSLEQLEDVVNRIESKLRNKLESEIPSEIIGEMVMTELRDIDQVAYIRFASVYRRFRDLMRFKEELDSLIEETVTDRSQRDNSGGGDENSERRNRDEK